MKTEAKEKRIKQYQYFKEKYPNTVPLFRCGDFYESYRDDARAISQILGITLTWNIEHDTNTNEGAMAGFPYHALDTYLPKLIRAGKRVAIIDAL